MTCLLGKWKVVPELTTGYDEFTDALGTPPEEKEKGRDLMFTLEISRDGDNWKQIMDIEKFPDAAKVYAFKSGEMFAFKGLDGKSNMRSTITVHSDKYTEVLGVEQKDGSFKEWDVVCERQGDMLKVTQTYRGAVEVIMLKRV